MGSAIVHFGHDDCSRVLILQSAGYSVVDCHFSERRLGIALASCDAIAVAESPRIATSGALQLLKEQPAPAILFASVDRALEPTQFDLVIPPLTEPKLWLERIQELLEKSKAHREVSKGIQAQSAALRDSSKKLRAESRAVRDLSRKIQEDSKLL